MENTQNMSEKMTQGAQNVVGGFKKLSIGVIIVIVVVVLLLWGLSIRNGFVTKSQNVDAKFSIIDTNLQRRFDLIPNLVSTVKGLTKQEQEVFGTIAEARSHYAGATTTDAKAQAAGQFESALGRLLVITENYPALRSSEAFQTLMAQLEGTENRIAVSRKDYNDAVQDYNTTVVRFPANIVAKIFGYQAKTYFTAPEAAKINPQVNFQ
jgi:LemA protein